MTMPQTYDSTHDDRLLLAYLLRLLTEEQAERVELATLTDDEVAERLKVVENDLVDSYIRDTLDAGTRDRFESYYLSSPIRRERVRFAAEFLRAIDAAGSRLMTPGTERVPGPSAWTSRGWRLLAVAATLILTSGTLLLMLSGSRGTPPGSGAATAIDASRTTPPAPSSAAAAPGGGTPAVESQAIGLVLLPQTRALSGVPALSIAPHSNRIRFELRLESNDYSRYQAALRDPRTNATIWRSAWIAPIAATKGSAVEVAVPAALLKTQHYSLDLTGRATSGTAHIVGSYAFNVTPP